MAKLSKTQWLDVRDKWESDPKLSFGNLAVEYGISRQAITLKARRESWQKTGNLAAINRAATRKADNLTDVDKVDVVDNTPSLKKDVGFDVAVEKRVDVLAKHRRQIAALDTMQDSAKTLFDMALAAKMMADDVDESKAKTAKNLWWQAKIAADIVKDHCAATKLKQDSERKSWGMDELVLSQSLSVLAIIDQF